ncbi:MAG: RNA polymerase subunit sigma-24 [Rhodocyclales bacterium CG17_big_fil_post_rev_8_21_14_2_50_68_7]|nr:MAG: RNA polymerase subunit sigma-24 [Rhodocyclales bacterium CG17_big_fil_post_rev_8_21_14_2_50_68_7]
MDYFHELHKRTAVRREVQRLRPAMYRVACGWCHDPSLADDLVQEAVEKALRNAGQARDPERLQGWLYSILANCLRDHYRAVHVHEDVDALGESLEDGGAGPEELCSRGQTGRQVRRAVSRLPLGQRQVLILVDLEECSYAKVGEALRIPLGTVMSRLCRARATLRAALAAGLLAERTTRLRSVK